MDISSTINLKLDTEIDLMSEPQLEAKEVKEILPQSYTGAFWFLFKQSWRDVKRHKCQYCLGFSSVFITVLLTLIINTIMSNGPIIFLRLAEGNVGEIDAIIEASENIQNGKISTSLVNLTHFNLLYPEEYLLSPRKRAFAEFYTPENPSIYPKSPKTGLLTYTSSQLSTIEFDHGRELKLVTIDTEQERKNNCGHNYKFSTLNLGEWVINNDFSTSNRLTKGDNIFLSLNINQELRILFDHFKFRTGISPSQEPSFETNVIAPWKFVGSFTSTGGKLPNSDDSKVIFMELEHFFEWVAPYVEVGDEDPTIAQFREFLKGNHSRGYDFADYVVMNFPSPRTDFYKHSSYDDLQDSVIGYTNKLKHKLGFFPQSIKTDLLEELQTLNLGLMFIGIIFTIISVLFVSISVLLIYSLLMATVEEKSIEIGIYRILGVNKLGLITMVLLKAFFFTIPALVTGFWMSFLVLWIIFEYGLIFSSSAGITPKPIPTLAASLYALFVGLIIPVLSSLYPMKVVLSKTLTDALNYSTAKTKAVFIQIIYSNNLNKKPYLVFGSLSVIYGLCIYYFLPLAFISLDFSLLIRIFFLILVGMFLGLTLLALNLQRMLEVLFVYIFLFYERTSTRMIVLKNMTAHKPRNRTTILIYAISVGFIIMIIVSFNLEIQTTTALSQLAEGHYLYAETTENEGFSPLVIENLIRKSKDKIEYLGYETHKPKDTALDLKEKRLFANDRLSLININIELTGITPFFGHTLMNKYLKMDAHNTSTSLGIVEQLYTPRGMQAVGVPGYIRNRLGLDPTSFTDTLRINLHTSSWNIHSALRCLWSTESFPGKYMTARVNSNGYDTVVSVPSFKRLVGSIQHIKHMQFRRVAIQLKEPDNIAHIKEIRDALQGSALVSLSTVYDHLTDSENLGVATSLLSLIFNLIIVSVMALFYFALSSSMSANMMEQKAEIGVLRAIGITKFRMYFLYIYEWFIMIFTGCITGVLVGTLIGWAMTLQRVLFTDIPLPFYFPWVQVIIIFVMSVIWAVVATVLPARLILRKEISQIFR